MTKQERQAKNEVALNELIGRTEAINALTARAEPYIKEYWSLLKDLWLKPVGYDESKRIKEQLLNGELKQLSKDYKNLCQKI